LFECILTFIFTFAHVLADSKTLYDSKIKKTRKNELTELESGVDLILNENNFKASFLSGAVISLPAHWISSKVISKC